MRARIYLRVVTLFLLLIVQVSALAQASVVKKAMAYAEENSIKEGQYFRADIPKSKSISLGDIDKVCSGRFGYQNIRKEERPVYGKMKTCITSFEFRSLRLIEQDRLEEIERVRLAKIAREKAEKEKAERLAAEELIRKEKARLKEIERKKAEEERAKLLAEEKIALKEKYDNERLEATKYFSSLLDKNRVLSSSSRVLKYGYKMLGNIQISRDLYFEEYYEEGSGEAPTLFHVDHEAKKFYTILPDLSRFEVEEVEFFLAEKDNTLFIFFGSIANPDKEVGNFLLKYMVQDFLISFNTLSADDLHIFMGESIGKSEFEEALGKSTGAFYRSFDYPRRTPFYSGFSGKIKVELSENLTYVIDKSWDYNEDLYCERCVSCDWFGGKGGREVEDKRIKVYHNGSAVANYVLSYYSQCSGNYYSLGNWRADSEYGALDNFEKTLLKAYQ